MKVDAFIVYFRLHVCDLITIALLAFSWLLFKGLLQQTWLGFLGFAFKYFNLLFP